MSEITWGSCFISPRPDIGLLIFGYIFTEEEVAQDERRLGADLDEIEMTIKNIRRGHQRGTMYAMAYSTACVKGELGFVQRAMCLPITEEQFAQALSAGCNPRTLIESEWLKDILLDAADQYLKRDK